MSASNSWQNIHCLLNLQQIFLAEQHNITEACQEAAAYNELLCAAITARRARLSQYPILLRN